MKLILLSYLFIGLANSVDRGNFKTCSDSSFCTSHRARTTKPVDYELLPDSVDISTPTTLLVDVRHVESGLLLTLTVTRIRGAGFRLSLREKNPVRPRFEIPAGSSLVEELLLAPLTLTRSPDGLAVTSEGGPEKLFLFTPFRADLLLHDDVALSVNARGLLRYNSNASTGEETFKGHRDPHNLGDNSIGVDVRLEGCEHAYGLPEHADTLALRSTENGGDPYRLYNLDVFEYELDSVMALYGAVPLLYGVSPNRSVGVFWHNPTETWVDVQSSKAGAGVVSKLWSLVGSESEERPKVDSHWFAEAGVIDLFLMVGGTPVEVVRQYQVLTGTTPLPPMFGIAYHQCRWNYNDETDLLNVESKFDAHDIPVDVLWLDIEHTDTKKYFTWDNAKFPDPVGMVAQLASRGRKLVTVIDPHIKREGGWNIFEDAKKQGIFVKTAEGNNDYDGWCWPGSSAWPDFLSARVREWWARQFLTHPGSKADNTFTWNDMGEPSVFNGPEVTMHKDALHSVSGGWEHREVHNLYGLEVHRASWQGQLLRSDNQRRPFVLTRAFFAGSQRFGAVWTGDNTAAWSHLKASIPMVLSLCLAGIQIAGADVGGFFGNPEPELLTRWYQAAAFQPFYRAHAHLDSKRREPWLLPEEHIRAVRNAIRLRYALLPYWYAQFKAAADSGTPVVAPLWLHFPKDASLYELEDQHMVGPGIMVKPVTDAGASRVDVTLPGTSSDVWYYQDGWQGFVGGQRVALSVNLDTIPYFVRGGHIVPRRERIRRASTLSGSDPYTLVVALDKTGYAEGRLYRDDEQTLRYKEPHSEFTYYQLTFADLTLTVHHLHSPPTSPGKGAAALPASRVERVVLLGLGARPRSVIASLASGEPRKLEFFYSAAAKVLVVRKPDLPLDADSVWTLRLRYSHDEL